MSDTPRLDADALRASGLPVTYFAADERIFSYGDDGDTMFVVLTGRVKLVHYGAVLENVEPGGLFGEMSLIDAAPRSATAIAVEPAEVTLIDRTVFRRLVKQDPDFALAVMRGLADRLRRMNENM